MGLGIGDYKLDGTLGILKTHFADDTTVLYENNGKGEFTDVTLKSGLGVETRYVCWGAGIVDLDNDGLPDIFIAAGQVFPELERRAPLFPYKNPRIVFRNLGGGRFEELFDEAGPAIAAPHSSRGCAFGDFDNDGDIDIVIMNMNEPPSLLRNEVTGGNHWLKVQLEGKRHAIGARVTARYGVRQQVQEVMSQSSFLSVNDKRLHFGLGAEASADLDLRWPNGAKQTFSNVPANHLISIREGVGIVAARKPPFTS
jgi:enediyne biosynthesis protein E4